MILITQGVTTATCAHSPDQPHYFARLANNLHVLETLQQQRKIERNNGNQIYHVHLVKYKLPLIWGQKKSSKIFDGEERYCKLVNDLGDGEDDFDGDE